MSISDSSGPKPVQGKCGSSALKQGSSSCVAVQAQLLLGTPCQHCKLAWLRIYPYSLAGYQKCCTSGARSCLSGLAFQSGSAAAVPFQQKEELRTTGVAAVLPEYIMMNVGLTPLGYVCNKAWAQFWLDLRFAAHPRQMFCSPMIVWIILWFLAI